VAASGPAPQPGDPHQVECRGEVHRIALRDGALTAIDHDPAQLRREELLVALGGPALPCLWAIDEVHRNPEALPAVQERLGHGDVAGALAVVEGLLGPGAVLRDGPLREELESAVARGIDHGLFRHAQRRAVSAQRQRTKGAGLGDDPRHGQPVLEGVADVLLQGQVPIGEVRAQPGGGDQAGLVGEHAEPWTTA
jgi:hypothetical protein